MKYTFLLLLLISFFGCNETDDDNASSKICSADPLENVEWLKELVNNPNPNGLEIIQYDYKQQTVFSINNCLNCADGFVIVYDCKKNKVCEFGGIAGINTCPDFDTKAINKKVLFTDRNCEKGTIISPKLYKKLKPSPITSAEINGNCLNITFSILSTQDRIEDVILVDSGEVLESMPTQRRIKFNIKENLTKPISISATTFFDVSNLAEQGETIILNIDGFDTSIEYTRVP
ncbi:DUF6970 domain-containing protein [Flavivirga rizhaonensis]|uniref:DUF6970 domain-containing protein n=1 Tax=Flavivirga rizhaonensis TaxID=2559571 RepID=A0A4S1E0G0_9FLAO|nr:hypothetical protein [Flavivirga rizhaonensis]TGV03980.1 hypothetical protein EM932_04080 [Flavivirga rizhaonensis]